MWTTVGALAIISVLGLIVWRYIKADAEKQSELDSANAEAKAEQERRKLQEQADIAESNKRLEDFNEKVSVVSDPAGAIELLQEAAGRTAHRPVQPGK